jgi:pyruvate ferredoxin oxidoreductase gamma subunit
VSFCRIDDKEIRLREPILEPDGLIVQDPTLFKAMDVVQGLGPERLSAGQYQQRL